MRIKITFDGEGLILPRAYKHILQGIIYNLVKDNDIATKLHDKDGFKYFNYSDLKGDFYTVDNDLFFNGDIYFYVSSISLDFINTIIETLNKNKNLIILNNEYKIKNIEKISFRSNSDKIRIAMISPLTVHDTILNKTVFYSPKDREFYDLINANFKRKFNIQEDKPLILNDIQGIKKIITKYKGFIIEGYIFNATLQAKNSYLRILFNCGLGCRNSSGFGMFRIVESYIWN